MYHCALGQAVINAAENGISFPLKRRDQLLDYILTLMGSDEEDGFSESNIEHLRTQVCVLPMISLLNAILLIFIRITTLLCSKLLYFYLGFWIAVACFKCLHYSGFCRAKIDY